MTSLWGDFLFSCTHLLFGGGCILGFCYLKCQRLRTMKVFQHWIIVIVCGPLLLYANHIWGDLYGENLQAVLTGALCMVIVFCSLIVNAGPLLPVFKMLGDASYSIYLVHPAFLSASLGVMHSFMPELEIKIVYGVAVMIAILAGCVVHFMVERPLLLKLSKG